MSENWRQKPKRFLPENWSYIKKAPIGEWYSLIGAILFAGIKTDGY